MAEVEEELMNMEELDHMEGEVHENGEELNVDKETGEKVFETQVMEVLQALIMKTNLDAGTAHPNPTMVKIKEICEKGLEVAHKHNIVRTQVEAAVADEEEEIKIEPWQRAPGPRALE